ncbi:hypothetical protein LSM04_005447 [Trypanosoma melophagium]|uniref:uncharacterized protein n=1 Tax=Trypanosoma melophagium TaxID=715481 RepID=UPI00351A4160|nr:hypothetical protein LSM04_005447 [Trypanosoma melophagium]
MGAIVGKCRETEKTRSVPVDINRRGSSLRCVVNTPTNHTTFKPSSLMLSETNLRGLQLKRTSLVNNNSNSNMNNNHDTAAQTAATTKGDLGENEVCVKKQVKPAPAPLAVPLSSCLVQSKYTANSGRNTSLTCVTPPPEAQERRDKKTAGPHMHSPPTNNITAMPSDESFDLQSDADNGMANDEELASGPLPKDNKRNSNSNSGSAFALPVHSPSSSPAKNKKTPLSSDVTSPRGSYSLMECSFDSGGPTRDKRAGIRRSSSISSNTNDNSMSTISNNSSASGGGGSKTTTSSSSVSPFLPFLAAHHADERSAKSFVDYLTKHALFLRSSRELTWFNVDFSRTQLRRRTREAMISWNPLEEIAYNDSEDSSTEAAENNNNSNNSSSSSSNNNNNNNDTPAATATTSSSTKTTTKTTTNTTTTTTTNNNNNNNNSAIKETKSPTRGPLQQRRQKRKQEEGEKDDEMPSTVRSRVRPIISNGVPHHMQLAKKALEDNVIFFHSRSPKFF